MAGLNKEIWLQQIMEAYRQKLGWMNQLEDMSAFVENNTINLSEAGVDPAVLVNNTTYPVAFAERADTPYAIPLDVLDTEGTVIRNARLIELSYDKMASVTRGHVNALQQFGGRRSSHAISPAANGTNTPVIGTSGADNGSGFKLITEDDIAKLAGLYDAIDAPDEGRILVLHPTMFNELIRTSPTLKEQRYRSAEGKINAVMYELFGFQIEKFRSAAVYNKTTGAKKAWGAAAAPATDTISSFGFVKGEVMKAIGDYEMFERLNDPEQKGDIVNFQQRFISMPKRNKFISAIYAAAV